ncbi:hypothetical protein NDU88_002338 [Pleurodeles waltl]|uniref:Uncharacterized protein n=1 Tax=Pleurodeles waltl TaxID=8319 RepID=A0AAV7VEA6_PLEWA|nr:hypothetical protein NDU88_002338 [Pleurodeles waltl]
MSVGAETHQGPQPSPGTLGSTIRLIGPGAAAVARGPLDLSSGRPAASRKTVASSERRGRKPPPAPDGPPPSPAHPWPAAEAQPCRPAVHDPAIELRGGTARAVIMISFFRNRDIQFTNYEFY